MGDFAVAVTVLLGTLPTQPEYIDAATIRALRAPDGSPPCRDGLNAGLMWIQDRRLPFAEALAEARERLDEDWVQWAEDAILSGYGFGAGDYGSGTGHGDGGGCGTGDGYGTDAGDGDGCGSSYSVGGGAGYGTGDCYGYGYGTGGGRGAGGFGGYG